MEKLDRLLDYIEENIDTEHIKKVEKLHLDAIGYKPVPYLPLALVYQNDDFKPFPMEEAIEDPAKMMYNELNSTVTGTGVYNSVRLKDHFPPHIRSSHGIGILPSLFGAECKVINNNMPWVVHLETDKIRKAISKGVPDFYQGLGKKVVDTHKFYLDKLKGYPKCSQCIRVTQPDMQGPFDIAHLMVGEDIFYGLYDYPEFLHELLQIITQTYIGFRKYIENFSTDHAGDNAVYLHGCIFGGKVLIKDDTAAINLSEQMYNEFSKKYNDEILEAFKGGSMHYCGPSRPWHFKSMYSDYLKGMNYGNPEMQDLNSLHNYLSEKKIPSLLWGDVLCTYRQDRDFIGEIRKLGIKTGMSLMIRVGDFEEAKRTFESHLAYAES